MKNWRKALLALVCLCLALPLAGCSLVSVNPEKDNATVIATVDGKDVLKQDYNNMLALVEMQYDAAGQALPTGGDLKSMKENIYDTLIQQKVLALQADKDGLKIDEAAAKKQADATLKSLKQTLGNDKYKNILNNNYATPESFEKWIPGYEVEAEKATKAAQQFQDNFKKDPSKVLDEAVGTINGEAVTRGEYEYRMVGESLNYYMKNGTAMPNDEDTLKKTNQSIFENIEKTRANIAYCKDNGIAIADDAVKKAQDVLASTTSYFFQDDATTEQFLSNYYLTKASYNQYQNEEARGNAAADAIKAKCVEDAKVTDKDIEKYYNDNKENYDTTTVSAMHILTEDEKTADAIYKEAKDITNKADFAKLVEKYKGVTGITEASDLGSFDYKTMVKPFSEAAFKAKLNTVTKPVKTDFGYHVIFVYDRKDGAVKALDEVKSDIEKTLKNQKGQEAYDKVEKDIVKGAKYDIYDIQSPLQEYVDQLKKDDNVVEHENKIRA